MRLLGNGRPARDAIPPARVQRPAAEPQIRDAPAGARRRIARVGQAAHPHHVAALLVIRVRVEEVVTDVLEQRLQCLARHVGQRRLRVRERRLAHHVVHGDRLPGQQRAAPAEARRQRDLRPLHRHERVQQHLVPRAVEVAPAVEQALGDGEWLRQSRLPRRAEPRDERVHLRIGRQEIGEHRQQPIANARDAAAADVEIEHREELAARAGVGHERGGAAALHDDRARQPVVRMAAEDGVQAAHTAGELQVDVRAVVREQHDRARAAAPRVVDRLLQVLLLDPERPLRHEVPWIRDRRVGIRLPDHRHRHAVDLAQRVGREHGIAEVQRLDVVGDEVDPALEVALDDLPHARGAVRELPVAGHHVHAQGAGRVDHILAARP